jgi:hypothetical protein
MNSILGVGLDALGAGVAACLTLCIFSYLLGLKTPYRLATHILIGAGAMYAVLMAWSSIVYPRVVATGLAAYARMDIPMLLFVGVGALLGVLSWFKLFRATAEWGNISIAYLVGVGVGVAAGGALAGTLGAQTRAATQPGNLEALSFLVAVTATLTVLAAFTFTANWRKGALKHAAQLVAGLSVIGRAFLYMTLGAVFAGVYVASVSVLIGQLQFLGRSLAPLLQLVLSQLGPG